MGVTIRRKASSRSCPHSPYFTWGCADDLQGRLRKTLYVGEEQNCFDSTPSVALTDYAVSKYLAAAPSSKRKLTPNYASSVARRIPISPCTLMVGILYSERLRQVNQEYLSKISSSDLFVVSLLVASKYLNDEGEDDEVFNDEWAEAGGLAICTVNRLEREFLNALEWNAYVGPEEFFNFCSDLETKIALKNGLWRGWFSYTDLTQCMTLKNYQETLNMMMENTMKVVTGCALVYSLSVGVLTSSIVCYNTFSTRTVGTKNNINTSSDPVASFHSFSNRPLTRKRNTTLQDACVVDDASEDMFTLKIASAMLQDLSEYPGKSQRETNSSAQRRQRNLTHSHSNGKQNQSRNESYVDSRNPPWRDLIEQWVLTIKDYGFTKSEGQLPWSSKLVNSDLTNIPWGQISSLDWFTDHAKNKAKPSPNSRDGNFIKFVRRTGSIPCNFILAGKGTSLCSVTSSYPLMLPCVS